MIAVIAKPLSKAWKDSLKPRPLPNSKPNNPFSNPLQHRVNAISIGIFSATYQPITGERQKPIVNP